MKPLKNLHPLNNKKNKLVEQVCAITHSSDAVGWSPVDYVTPNSWEVFKANFETEVTNFIATAKPDIYNPHFREDYIMDALNIALTDLDLQEIKHHKSIVSIQEYQEASLKDLMNKKAQIDEEIKKLEEELNEESC